jgi:hypothetical protein
MANLQNISGEDTIEFKTKEVVLPLIHGEIQNVLDALPLPTALLDNDEKIVAVNKNFLKLFADLSKEDLIGRKSIDIFKCVFASDVLKGGYSTGRCQNCSGFMSINSNNTPNSKLTERCNLTFINEAGKFYDHHNMKLTKSPLVIDSKQYYLFSLIDISHEVKRKLLERIFFHDILNKAANIVGILDVINLIGIDDERSPELYESLKETSQELIKEIKYQRDLSAAENNELTPVFIPVQSLEVLNLTKNEIINSDIAVNKEIVISASSVDQQITTDEVLLRRVLINMLKNALEATKPGGTVWIGCENLAEGNFRFWVQNDAPIPEDIQLQLFNRPTSTKSNSRGLGTFSMRLVGEKYLKGSVNFVSSKEKGTRFMIDLPLNH